MSREQRQVGSIFKRGRKAWDDMTKWYEEQESLQQAYDELLEENKRLKVQGVSANLECPQPHSPLPWKQDGVDINDAAEDPVCEVYPNEGGGFVNEADAAYAVWACNNAQRLVEENRKLREQIDMERATP